MPVRPLAFLKAVRTKLRNRPDTEHMMSLNRAIFCVVLTVYVETFGVGPEYFRVFFPVYGFLATISIFLHILYSPSASIYRRTVALVVDIATITMVMHLGDEPAAVFFPLIMWTIFGNGFRFGVSSLWCATAVGFTGFTLMAFNTPFWANNISVTAGLMIGLLIVPAYASVLIKSLTRAKVKAEAASNAKSAFLTSVSHELRTPLQAIVGTGSLMLSTAMTAEQTSLCRTAKSASEALLAMIDDLLQFSNIESGGVQVEKVEFEVVDLLHEARELALVACKRTDLSIAIHVSLDVPLRVVGDRRHILEILINMSANAVKFTSQGGVLLAVSSLNLPTGEAMLEFEVVDTGIGVAPDMRDHIFERFTQADGSIAKRFGGTGLGLAICKGLVVALKGQIGVRDGLQPGSTFWFRIPVAVIDGQLPARAPVALMMANNMAKSRLFKFAQDQTRSVWHRDLLSMPVGERLSEAAENGRLVIMERSVLLDARKLSNLVTATVLIDNVSGVQEASDPRWDAPVLLRDNFTDQDMEAAFAIGDRLLSLGHDAIQAEPVVNSDARRHILIVDDNRTNQLIFTKMLESRGHACSTAADGEQALIALEQDRFDLVLMDVNMPGIDGIEATKLQRVAELGLDRVPIVGLTADASGSILERCRAAGMDDCLVKPVSVVTLLDVVKRVTAQSPTRPPELMSDANKSSRPFRDSDFDRQPLIDLEALGGRPFVFEVLEEFVRDAHSLVKDLSSALGEGEFAKARSVAHAIASVSANVGASRLRLLGLELQHFSEARFRASGYKHLWDIQQALNDYLASLDRYDGRQAGEDKGPKSP